MKRWEAAAVSEVPPRPPEEGIVERLKHLRLLHSVPLAYLIPDERMLQQETLRFFTLDAAWLDALCDGTLSLRRAATAEAALRSAAIAAARGASDQTITGFLLRSVVVWRWPTLDVSACGAGDVALTPLRCDRPAPDVLLALYAGTLQKVTFSEPAETQHFGFDVDGDVVRKRLRSPGGEDAGRASNELTPVPMRGDRVIDVRGFSEQLGKAFADDDFTPAEFALQLVQGVDRVDFTSTTRPQP